MFQLLSSIVFPPMIFVAIKFRVEEKAKQDSLTQSVADAKATVDKATVDKATVDKVTYISTLLSINGNSLSAQSLRSYPLSYFSFQPVLHDWCNKGRGTCYPVCGMVHIKEPLLLIDKSSLCGDSGFPFSLSEWSLTICLTPYNRR